MKSVIQSIVLAFVGTLFFTNSFAQYYYKDILSNKDLLVEMAKYKEQKIRTISVKSFEEDGTASEGFFLEKKISKNFRTVETLSRSYMSSPSMLTANFNSQGLLERTSDSSDIAVRSSNYSYSDKGQLLAIYSSARSSDDDFLNEITEAHLYEYDANGLLLKMYRIKNNADTTLILFSADEKGNVSIEKDTKSGSKYFYYYDTKNRLTDVAHANDFQQNMYPDYMFEYNAAGQITQMVNTEEGANKYYFTWKYSYADGLRIKEKCYSKEKRLLGSVDYEYK